LDTNSDPEGIDYPIPGNDDARRSIDLYCNLIKETINNAKKELPKIEEKEVKKPEVTKKKVIADNELKEIKKVKDTPLN